MIKIRIIITAIAVVCGATAYCAQRSVIIDGVKYMLNDDSSVSCRAADKKSLVHVEILPLVAFDNLEYYVTRIDKNGFADCRSMKSVTVPNSVTTIGEHAFWDCHELESVVMPDNAEAIIPTGNYGFGRYGIFHGCRKLARARGTNVMYPRYLVYDAFYECKEVPFYNTIVELGSAAMTSTKLNTNFSDFALSRIKEPVETWQRKKEYETMAQWESRVTEANRKKMIDEAISSARNEYVKTFAPASLTGKLEKYNADFGFFPIYTGSMGELYAKVPATEADAFAASWDKVEIRPVYGILDDRIAVLSCTFAINDKEYGCANVYDEDPIGELALNITPLASVREFELMAQSGTQPVEHAIKYDIDAIDTEIPDGGTGNDMTFAVIIGNENYQRVSHVDYAMNDARIFAKYCGKTLGIPEKNIRTYYDATFGDIVAAIDDIRSICSAYKGKARVIFYYAGHGIPDDSNRSAYILPIDANGISTEVCYPLGRLYSELSGLEAESVVAFIDACFSGSLRGEGMLASARGVKLRPRDAAVTGNLVVLSAASGDQSAFPYHEKSHGMFTYYLLDKLKSTAGDASLGDIAGYVIEEVSRQSIVDNGKSQIPNAKWSLSLNDTWKDIKLK